MKETTEYNYSKHLLVSASAGTGKTYTITSLIIPDLLKLKVEIDEIVVMTFTEKAATELKDRIRESIQTLENEYFEIKERALEKLPIAQIGTIHQFARNILKKYAYYIGYSNNFLEIEDEQNSLDEFFELFWKRIEKDDSQELIHLIHQISFSKFKDFIKLSYLKMRNEVPFVDTKKLDKIFVDKKRELQKLLEANLPSIQVSELNSLEEFKNLSEEVLTKAEKKIRTKLVKLHSIQKEDIEKIETCFSELNLFFTYFENLNIHSTIIEYVNLFFRQYNDYKLSKDLLSKDDLIEKSLELVKIPEVRKDISSKIKYLIVDESQDSNPIQIELIKTIFQNRKYGFIFVGDPKQSIYRFRKADLNSYHKVAQEIKSNEVSLDQSYRSSKKLISGFNLIFKELESFQNKIEYTNKKSYRENTDSKELAPAIILLGLDENLDTIVTEENETAVDYRKRVHLDSIQAIKNIVNNSNYKIFDKKKSESNPFREIEYSDIAILSSKNNDLREILNLLAQESIPANLYKSDEFYSDPVIIAISNLLLAIDDPQNIQALFLTLSSDLFLVSDEILFQLNELGETNYFYTTSFAEVNLIYQTIKKAHEERFKKSASLIIQEILDTNAVWEHLGTGFYAKRNLTNIYHLMEILNSEQTSSLLSFKEVTKLISERIKDSSSQEMKLEGDKKSDKYQSIQCMTIHASKGLEFPVCILIGMKEFSSKQKEEIYYDFETNLFEYRINSSLYSFNFDIVSKKEKKELEEELDRKLYVAMTRAKDFLILPMHDVSKKTYTDLKSKLSYSLTKEKISNLLEQNLASIGVSNRSEKIVKVKEEEVKKEFTLKKYSELKVDYTSILGVKISSFSSLNQKMQADDIDKEKEELNYFSETETKKKKFISLEDRARFGQICHKVMEEFSIPILEQTEEQIKMQIELLLEEYYEMDSVDLEGYTKQDAFLLCFQTLTKSYPMNLERNLFSKIIEWKYFLREKTFFMNINKDDSKMMIGIGDGIFQFQNKYYIIDWKTNFFANYTYEDGYKKVISEYSDQFMIYSANLRRHFIEINSEEKWDQVFGGMLFVFMRVEGEQGVVIVKPSLKEIDLYREKLKWRI